MLSRPSIPVGNLGSVNRPELRFVFVAFFDLVMFDQLCKSRRWILLATSRRVSTPSRAQGSRAIPRIDIPILFRSTAGSPILLAPVRGWRRIEKQRGRDRLRHEAEKINKTRQWGGVSELCFASQISLAQPFTAGLALNIKSEAPLMGLFLLIASGTQA